jgi:hypothetical protein
VKYAFCISTALLSSLRREIYLLFFIPLIKHLEETKKKNIPGVKEPENEKAS